MSAERVKAFVSYSWDDKEHQQWVTKLANDLRSAWGIDASIDLFELFDRTVNLNTMMIHALRDNDFVIMVLTEEYAKKAEALTGGVGFETVLSLPILKQHPDKLIPIMRHKGDFLKVFPFHLQDYYAIDFSNPQAYNEKLKELAHRLYRHSPIKKAPLGPIPQFHEPYAETEVDTRVTEDATRPKFVFADLASRRYREPTDLEKAKFMEESFNELSSLFDDLFRHLRDHDKSIEFTKDHLTSKKHGFIIFVNGKERATFKMWLSRDFGSNSIKFAFNPHDWENDNSYNEMVSCVVDKENSLKLQMTLAFVSESDAADPESIVRIIWRQHLEHRFK